MEQKYQGWTILVDADGCLTDGKKYVDSTGQRQLIAFHSRDSIACKALVEMGFQVIVLTHSFFEGITDYWSKYGAKIYTPSFGDPMDNKLNVAIKHPLDWEKTIGIGDDVTDICYLEKCKIVFMPEDKHPKLWDICSTEQNKFTMGISGGQGVLSVLAYEIEKGLIEKLI